MDPAPVTRSVRRAASEAAIRDAAWELVGTTGPDGTSLRDVARAAGCTHALVTRYFGSKAGLVADVCDRLDLRVAAAVDRAVAGPSDPVLTALVAAREQPSCVRLLVRAALGDLQPPGFPDCLGVAEVVAAAHGPARGRRRPDRRGRLCAYAASSMVLGWLTFEGLVVAGTGLAGVPQDRRDRGVATLARQVLVLVDSPSPPLARRAVSPPSVVAAADRSVGPPTSREALVVAAIELFSRDGPASVSVRDVAELAGVNQGLIYRHFGSKDALLAEAIERASTDLILASRSADGFDFDAVSWLLHHSSPVPRLLARTLADDVDIAAIREEYPVFDRLHAVIERRSTRRADPESFDSRLVVAATAAMALGSALWGEHLRPGLGLSGSAAIEAAVADIARWLAT